MKARSNAVQTAAPTIDEVLEGVVVRSAGGGVIVETAKGEGLVPLGELGLAPGADHRRAFPPGKTMKVVAIEGRGRLRFSAVGVARVEERKNFREFSASGSPATPGGALGSLGDVLRKKLGIAESSPEPEAVPAPVAAVVRAPEVRAPEAPAPRAAEPRAPEPEKPFREHMDRNEPRSERPGVVRRRKT